jgi:predicted nucleic acid-binding protein
MIVISDTSVITTLLQIGKADLLRVLYSRVLIPEAVRAELSQYHVSLPGFLECQPAADRKAVEHLLSEIHAGEAEAIVLAQETHADLLLMDEREGRKVAVREGLRVIGLVGILIASKRKMLIPSLRDVLRQIETDTTFFISQQTKNLALQQVQEL